MNARTFLVRGLNAGLIAGICAFVVAFTVGEPPVERAIELEESAAPAVVPETAPHEHAEADAAHTHDEESGITREQQSTWGLLTGTVVVGVALGGLMGLVAAGVAGRFGSLSVRASTAWVCAIGFVAVSLVPFLKYPAAPPAVGSGDTIGERTASYFTMLLISLLAAIVATAIAQKLRPQTGAWAAVVTGVVVFGVVVIVAGYALPTVDEIGAFPASTLWEFRVASLLTLATMWGALGLALSGMLGRVAEVEQERVAHEAARKEFAMSL